MNFVISSRTLYKLKKIFTVYIVCQFILSNPLYLLAESAVYSRPEQQTYSLKGLFAKFRGEKKEANHQVASQKEVVIASYKAEPSDNINENASGKSWDTGSAGENASSSKSSGFEGTQRIAPTGEIKDENTLPPAVISLGGRTSADDSDAFVDVLAPVMGKDSQFLFINPRATLAEESANEQNVGAGIRRIILDDHLIVGGNIFYDTRESERGFHYEQLGLGVELLTDWVDARANYYLPNNNGDRNAFASQENQEVETQIQRVSSGPYFTEHEVRETTTVTTTTTTTTHHFDKFESAMQGADVEIGVKIPVISNIAETRVFGGYYLYNSNFGKDIQGFKARLEVRAVPALILDAEWYEDKEVHGTDYYVGARARLPFDVGNLFTGKNPFEGTRDYFRRGPATLKSRMTDMVMRDIDVVLEESDFIEDLKRLKVDTAVETKVFNATLMEDITFVNGNNKGRENGTFEHPFDNIQEGVDEAFGDKFVYVGFAEDYKENVVLKKGVTLWGSGYVIFGIEDGIHGVKPTVNGQSLGPAITMADDTRVWGFHVINQNLGGPAQIRNVADQSYDISRVGVYAENKTNLEIAHQNLFEANSTSILFASEEGNFKSQIIGNKFEFNDNGIKIFGKGPGSGNMSTTIKGNALSSTGVGIEVNTKNYGHVKDVILGNQSTNTSVGLRILDETAVGGINETLVQNNKFNDNDGNNIEITITGVGGSVNLDIINNQANRSVNLLGMELKGGLTNGIGFYNANILNNVMNNNKFENIKVDLASDGGDLNVLLDGNQVQNSLAGNGVSLLMQSTGGGNMDVTLNNNLANSNAFFNVFTQLNSTAGGNINAEFTNNQASDGSLVGMLLNVNSAGIGDVNTLVQSNIANNNQAENIKLSLVTGTGDIMVDILSNQANSSDTNSGIFASGVVNISGSIDANTISNIANNNPGTNISESWVANNGDVDTVVQSNQASGSLTGSGLSLNQVVSGGSGSVTSQIINNTANNNSTANISGNFVSNNGDVGTLVQNNKASNSVTAGGINLNQVVSSGNGAVVGAITDNIANFNNGTNINGNFISNNDFVVVGVLNNEASNSITGLGINLNMVVSSGTGGVVSGIADNMANFNQGTNINGNFISNNDSVVVSVVNNEASNSVTSLGINLNEVVSSGTGNVVSGISDNIANNNRSENINGNFISNNGDVTVGVQNNEASGSVVGLGIKLNQVVSSGTGSVSTNILDNTATSNQGTNIDGNFISNNGDVTVTVQNNQASSSATGLGITLNEVVSSGTGSVVSDISNNNANFNQGTNINGNFISNNGDVNVGVQNNQASGSVTGQGINLNEVVSSGTGSVSANIFNNTATSNQGTNINGNLISNNGDVTVTVQNNDASNSVTSLGINLNEVVSSGTGNVASRISNNIADNNRSENINGNFISNNGDVTVSVENNQASGSVVGLGIKLNQVVSSGTGSVSANIFNNTATSNQGTNIDGNFISNNGDVTVSVQNNQASSSATGLGIKLNEVVSGGTGSVVSDISNNNANSNQGTNIDGNFISNNGDVTVTVQNNQASGSVTGQGINLNEVVSSGTGSVSTNIFNNTATSNQGTNINGNFISNNDGVVLIMANNQASNSNTGSGILLNGAVSSGTGSVQAQVTGNTANDNNGFSNIFININSNGADADVTVTGNQASLGSTLGILVDATANTSGNVNANILDNTATGNNAENMKIDLDTSSGDITVTVDGNTASDGNNIGILLEATGGAAGSGVAAWITDNTADGNNGFANIYANLDSNADNVNVTMSGNQANGGSTLGILLEGTANTSGNVNANVFDNTATGNNNENIKVDLDTFSGDITMTVNNNQATDSVTSIGLLLQATGNGAGSGVTASITNNITNDNNGFANIFADLDSNTDNVVVTMNNNQASGGSTLGILLNGTANVSGGVTAVVSNNTANGNSAENIKVDLDSNAANVDVTISGNQANSGGNIGIVLEANANGASGNVNALATGNVTSTNAATGFDVNLVSPDDITFTATSNTANGNTGGGSDGMNVFVDAGTGVGDDVLIYGERNVFRNNGNDGIELNIDSGSSTYTVDFGGGGLSSPGNNSFTNNAGFDLHDVSPAIGGLTIFARNNFWVDTTPDNGDEYSSNNANTIDVTGALAVDPNP